MSCMIRARETLPTLNNAGLGRNSRPSFKPWRGTRRNCRQWRQRFLGELPRQRSALCPPRQAGCTLTRDAVPREGRPPRSSRAPARGRGSATEARSPAHLINYSGRKGVPDARPQDQALTQPGLRGEAPLKKQRTTPSFVGLSPASAFASAAARGASTKKDTRCELVLRRELWRRGMHYRLHCAGLPGNPDIIFPKQRVAIFCDGDFWHGRDLKNRIAKLARGHNASYWVAKIQKNAERDRRQTRALEESGWVVLRFWETDVLRLTSSIVDQVISSLKSAAIKRLALLHSELGRRRSTPAHGPSS
jgi:DNA mismatch endonuclease, patch repair protein